MEAWLARATRAPRRACAGGAGRACVALLLTILASLGLVAPSARAMTVEVHGRQIFATGPVVAADYATFADLIARGGTDTVVLVNSPGGDLAAALTVGRLIAARAYKTIVAGSCMSACSILFMGGRERQLADAFRPGLTVIGIHGAARGPNKVLDPRQQPQMFEFYKARIGASFDAELFTKALYEMDDAGAFLRVPDTVRNPRAVPIHCRSALTPTRDCTRFAGRSMQSLGLITTTELAKIELPDAFKVKARLLGRELIDSVPPTPAHVLEFVNTICPTETCRQGVTDWVIRPENRTLALRRDGRSMAANWNRDTPNASLVNAIYSCNHVTGQPIGLCEARMVNNTDVRYLYEDAETGQRDALANLRPPAQKSYAQEESGGPVNWGGQLRTQRLQDLTPQRVEGVRALTTQELAIQLTSSERPALIDVGSGGFVVLPGADTLLGGGMAYEEPAREAEYEKRFLGLLALLAPDKSRPLVFYGKGRDNWMPVNAALRARRAGYTDVAWYRGGLDSWNAARLPTAPLALRAVVN